ncbi:MAG: hypothetical protein P8Y60_17135, partial [Calditrichota bacterium]
MNPNGQNAENNGQEVYSGETGVFSRFLSVLIIFGLIYYFIVWNNLAWALGYKWLLTGSLFL